METNEYEKISDLEFPNTEAGDRTSHFTAKSGCTFFKVEENGENAPIAWIGVFKEGKKIAQIKQSVCNIYF